jgi:hypothetical protein
VCDLDPVSGSATGGRKSTLQTLEQRYPIRYRDPERVPVQHHITGNKLKIRFFIRYSPKMLVFFPGTNITYADIFEAGVRTNWAGLYPLEWMADDGFEIAKAKASFRVLTEDNNPSERDVSPKAPSARVTVEFIRYGSPEAINYYPKQRFFKVSFTLFSFLSAHVMSPPWRWYWGFFRCYQVESTHLNWSKKHPGKVSLQRESSRHSFQQTSAHEIGHLLGIGDAYGASYRFFYEAPDTGSFMMCHNRRVQPQELEMTLTAHLLNRMQYFPKKFVLKTFNSGLKRALKLKINPISRKDRKRANDLKKSNA